MFATAFFNLKKIDTGILIYFAKFYEWIANVLLWMQ